MINFQDISLKTFLSEYWQKKPLIIRNALPEFMNPLSPDELAGLALEDDVESRMVRETPNEKPYWHLKRGPFSESDFNTLPQTHWTLLVQGVDRLVPEVNELLDYFDFIPQWRVDDIMISFAALHGGVGPHYDNYDVFLYQAQGRREWSLTTKECTNDNYIQDYCGRKNRTRRRRHALSASSCWPLRHFPLRRMYDLFFWLPQLSRTRSVGQPGRLCI
jgi:50S ribosomal protein L16 3-hydroxylase